MQEDVLPETCTDYIFLLAICNALHVITAPLDPALGSSPCHGSPLPRCLRIYSANSPSPPSSPRLKSLNTGGLRSSRLFVIRDPTRRQEEQRHKSPVTHLRVVMCACTWGSPSRSLPTLHTLQLRRLVQLHHAINLPVRVRMVLAGVFLLAVHVYRRDAQIAGLR